MTDNAVLLPFLDTEDEHSIKTTPRELLLQNASNTLLARNKELTAPQYLQHKNIKDIVFHRENTYFTDGMLPDTNQITKKIHSTYTATLILNKK
jgi:hypothetical protein